MENVTRTVWGSVIQSAQWFGMKYPIIANSTLNERFNVLKTTVPADGVYPKVQLFGIGIGGAKVVAGPDGYPRTEDLQHQATDASLFKPLPFVVRPANNDLSPAERQKYAMRVNETYNGVNYISYYLKRIDLTALSLNVDKRTISDGITTSTKFTPTAANLNPTPPNIVNSGANIVSSDYISASIDLPLNLTENDCSEILNSAKIIYGSEDYANISEFALCSGVDKTITLPDSTNFKESIYTQVVTFISTFHSIKHTNSGITGNYSVGVVEPLLKIG